MLTLKFFTNYKSHCRYLQTVPEMKIASLKLIFHLESTWYSFCSLDPCMWCLNMLGSLI